MQVYEDLCEVSGSKIAPHKTECLRLTYKEDTGVLDKCGLTDAGVGTIISHWKCMDKIFRDYLWRFADKDSWHCISWNPPARPRSWGVLEVVLRQGGRLSALLEKMVREPLEGDLLRDKRSGSSNLAHHPLPCRFPAFLEVVETTPPSSAKSSKGGLVMLFGRSVLDEKGAWPTMYGLRFEVQASWSFGGFNLMHDDCHCCWKLEREFKRSLMQRFVPICSEVVQFSRVA
ncbi:hypothetical protein L7F22_068626, partial [Adiantum nelumboides]|nr:hypothetical protein [Adiantum nelumboides]